MSRKTLLTETEIRQFLKLANLGAVGDTRIHEMSTGFGDLEEQGDPDELEKFAADDLEDDTMMGDEEAADDELEADTELDADLGAAPDGAVDGGQMVSVDDLMTALEDALEEVTGQPVSTEVDDDLGAPEDEVDMSLDVADDGGEMEMDMDVEEEPGMRNSGVYESQDALVKEVAKRVASRIKAKNDKTEMVDALAERIMKRLTK